MEVDDEVDEKGVALKGVTLEVLDEAEDQPLAQAVKDEKKDDAIGAALRAAGKVVWWNNGLWIIINGHWFYLKRWLGDQEQIASVYSKLSRKQAVALLDGFCRADGKWKSVRYDKAGEPTGQWTCSNSSFPLIDQLMFIAQLAGASVDLHLHAKAGKKGGTIGGREITFKVNHWALFFQFTKPARKPFQTAPLAKPLNVSAGKAGRGYYQYEDDDCGTIVYCVTVESNKAGHTANFLTQRLSFKRLQTRTVGVRAHAIFIGNCIEAERTLHHLAFFQQVHSLNKNKHTNETLASAAVNASFEQDVQALIVLSVSGNTARLVAKYRPACPIICITTDQITSRQLHLTRGVYPVYCPLSFNPKDSSWAAFIDSMVTYGIAESQRKGREDTQQERHCHRCAGMDLPQRTHQHTQSHSHIESTTAVAARVSVSQGSMRPKVRRQRRFGAIQHCQPYLLIHDYLLQESQGVCSGVAHRYLCTNTGSRACYSWSQ